MCPARVQGLSQGKGLALDVAAVGADHGLELAGFTDEFQILVVELEQLGIDGEGDGAALTGLEADALKSLEFLHRSCDAAHHVADVELNHLGALNGSSVGDVDTGGNLAACGHGVAAQRHRAVFKGGVAQTVAKGEQRVVGDIQIVGRELGEPLGIGAARV